MQQARLLYYLERFEDGLAIATKAREAAPEDPGAILWWTANKGAMAAQKKNLASLGAIRDIEVLLKKLKKLDASYGFGAADRVLGRIYQEAPRFVSIGSSSKAEECLKSAMKIAPEFPGNQIAWAEFLWEEGKKDEAKEIAHRLAKNQKFIAGQFGEFSPDKIRWTATLEKILGGPKETLP